MGSMESDTAKPDAGKKEGGDSAPAGQPAVDADVAGAQDAPNLKLRPPREPLTFAGLQFDFKTPQWLISLSRTPAGKAVVKALTLWGARSARFLDYLAVDPRRRLRAAIILALAVNTILFTALAVFGHGIGIKAERPATAAS